MKAPLEDDHFCFACGQENLEGLRLVWKMEGQKMAAEFIPLKKHQGWKGIVHGGILATLLDEAMTRLAWTLCGGALTAEMTIRYTAPARVGEKLFVCGEIVKEARKLLEMRAHIYHPDPSGILIAHSTGKAIITSHGMKSTSCE